MQVLKDGQDVRGASCVVVVVVCSVVGSLINYVFGTSTISFCHRVRQSCWMVGASSGRLDHIGCLDFSRGRG